jgi:hypothetical protein
MILTLEHSLDKPGLSKWTRVTLTYRDNAGLIISHRYSSLELLKDGSWVVSYFTPSGKYFNEKQFPKDKYETAWRFM